MGMIGISTFDSHIFFEDRTLELERLQVPAYPMVAVYFPTRTIDLHSFMEYSFCFEFHPSIKQNTLKELNHEAYYFIRTV